MRREWEARAMRQYYFFLTYIQHWRQLHCTKLLPLHLWLYKASCRVDLYPWIPVLTFYHLRNRASSNQQRANFSRAASYMSGNSEWFCLGLCTFIMFPFKALNDNASYRSMSLLHSSTEWRKTMGPRVVFRCKLVPSTVACINSCFRLQYSVVSIFPHIYLSLPKPNTPFPPPHVPGSAAFSRYPQLWSCTTSVHRKLLLTHI